MIKIKNDSGTVQTYAGQEVPDQGEYNIPDGELPRWADDALALTQALSGLMLVWDANGAQVTGPQAIATILGNVPKNVVTALEKNDKDLKMATIRVATDPATGIAVVQIKSPGTPGVAGEGRYIMGAEAFFKSAHPEDRITKSEVVDVDDILGYGAGTVLKSYHDDEAPEENQGWFIGVDQYGPDGQNGSFVEVKPLGGYAFLPAGLWLRITAVKDPASKTSAFFANLLWGKYSP